MNYKINKELFEAVCSDKIFNYINTSDRIIFEFGHNNHQTYMSINDFFFKCKEWALEQGYELSSGYRVYGIQYEGNKSENKLYCDCRYIENGIQVIRFKANSEQQAVFDACMYILDKDKQ